MTYLEALYVVFVIFPLTLAARAWLAHPRSTPSDTSHSRAVRPSTRWRSRT